MLNRRRRRQKNEKNRTFFTHFLQKKYGVNFVMIDLVQIKGSMNQIHCYDLYRNHLLTYIGFAYSEYFTCQRLYTLNPLDTSKIYQNYHCIFRTICRTQPFRHLFSTTFFRIKCMSPIGDIPVPDPCWI